MNDSKLRIPRSALVLVASRSISNLGSALTTFGLNVWIFRETGSYATFAFLTVLAALPSLVFALFAGIIVDRTRKKPLFLVADGISIIVVAFAFGVYSAGLLNIPLVAAIILLLSLSAELRWAAIGPAISMMVAKDQLGRINGFQQSLQGIVMMFGPILGAVGLDLLGLPVLFLLDLFTYFLAILGLQLIDLKEPAGKAAALPPSRALRDEMSYGFRWVFGNPGLRQLLLFFMAINVGLSIFAVTFTPYLLSFESSRILGLCLGLQGGGGFLTGMLLMRWRKQRNHERMIAEGSLGLGLVIVMWGMTRSEVGFCVAAFLVGVMTSIIMVSSQTVWQTHVPVAIQGKVFSVRKIVAFGLSPLSQLFSITLATWVFGPILATSGWVAAVWGNSSGSALGLMVSTLGVGVAICAAGMIGSGGFKFTNDAADSSAFNESSDLLKSGK